MITYEQATQTDPTITRFTYIINNPQSRRHGDLAVCRRNGRTKTWKTRPGHFKIPVKYGLYEYFYITHENSRDFYAGDVPAEMLGGTAPTEKTRSTN